MKLKSIIILCIMLSGIILNAQNVVSGKVVDTQNAALSFANVILYQNNDQSVVTGMISNDDGSFEFNDIPDGSYWVEISMLGFETKKSELFTVSKDHRTQVLNFTLAEESETLGTVVIKSKRPVIRQTSEKLIVDLEKSQMVSSNLQDVMKKVPGIIATNGGITYGGQQGIRILINGKTTDYMDTASLLRDMPADNIAKIELIQQPGAEFDAEGSGPIINIILKKNVRLGTHGNVKLSTGYDNEFEYGTSASVASYKNKLNWQLGAGYRKSAMREDLFIKRIVNDQTYDQATISPFDPRIFRMNGSLDYYLDKHHTIGFSARRIHTDSDRIASNSTTVIENNTSSMLFTDNSFDRERVLYNINPYYEFSDDKNKLIVDFNYVDYDNDNENNLYQVGQSSILYNNQRYFQDGNYTILTYRGDYKRTVNDNLNWMVGAKYSKVNTDSDLQSFTQDINGDFIFEADQSNQFLVDEDILAIYAKLTAKIDKWSFTGGLRWEDSDTRGTSVSTNETRSRAISKLFPSASIGRQINENFGVNISYSYRIRQTVL